MRGGHRLKVWTKKQLVVSLSTAEGETVRTTSEGLGIQNVTKDLGIVCGLNVHCDAPATMCLVNRSGLGKTKCVDMSNFWIQEASKLKRFVTEKVEYERERRRLDDETTAGTKDCAACENLGP